MKEIPHLRALVQRHRDDPFALVGVNTDEDRERYRDLAEELDVSWRSAWQGSTAGPIPRAWNVTYYPTVFVLDAEGRIRHRDVRGDELDRAVATLIAEAKARDGEGLPAAER